MLTSLHVENLALIDEEEVEFFPGLNILTGETGAGKSILLGALGLALGGKADRDMVRDPEKDAYVEAVFSVPSPSLEKKLRDLDIETYDGEVILSRRIRGSRTVAKINGETVPSLCLKEAGGALLDLYGQRDHASLLKENVQLSLLDSFAGPRMEEALSSLKSAYGAWKKKAEELASADTDASSREREAGFLTQEIKEIEDLSLKPGEDEGLEEKYRRMKNGERIASALGSCMRQTDGEDGAGERLDEALRELTQVSPYDEKGLTDLTSLLTDADSLISDFNRGAGDYLKNLEFDPEDFEETEERLDAINRLKDRYGNTIDQILTALEEKKERSEKLSHYDAYLADLRKEKEDLEKELEKKTSVVTAIRKETAPALEKKLTAALKELNFLDVRVSIDLEEIPDFEANGREKAHFLIAMNPGEPLRPLKDVASGGELSRIMLAVKTVSAEKDSVDTLIFDEIDAGISGRTAQKVAEKLAGAASFHQVICITHLPQIASMADHHYLVEKQVEEGRTLSSIRPLSGKDKTGELARMLGGTRITPTVLKSAEEMLKMAEEYREKIRTPHI